MQEVFAIQEEFSDNATYCNFCTIATFETLQLAENVLASMKRREKGKRRFTVAPVAYYKTGDPEAIAKLLLRSTK